VSGNVNDKLTAEREKTDRLCKMRQKESQDSTVSSLLEEIILHFKARKRTKFFCYLHILLKPSRQRPCPLLCRLMSEHFNLTSTVFPKERSLKYLSLRLDCYMAKMMLFFTVLGQLKPTFMFPCNKLKNEL